MTKEVDAAPPTPEPQPPPGRSVSWKVAVVKSPVVSALISSAAARQGLVEGDRVLDRRIGIEQRPVLGGAGNCEEIGGGLDVTLAERADPGLDHLDVLFVRIGDVALDGLVLGRGTRAPGGCGPGVVAGAAAGREAGDQEQGRREKQGDAGVGDASGVHRFSLASRDRRRAALLASGRWGLALRAGAFVRVFGLGALLGGIAARAAGVLVLAAWIGTSAAGAEDGGTKKDGALELKQDRERAAGRDERLATRARLSRASRSSPSRPARSRSSARARC